MPDDAQILKDKVREILADAEAPYGSKASDVFLERAWENGAAYMAERVLKALETGEVMPDPIVVPDQPSVSKISMARLRRLLAIWERFVSSK